MEDIFDKLSAVTGITKYSSSEIPTPKWVVVDMVDLLLADVFAPEARFLDPAVKSGRFLVELYNRLMASPSMVQAFPNEQDRHKHILENQLYGLATSPTAATIVRKQLYNDPTIAGNIVYVDNYLVKIADKTTDFKKLVQGEFGADMKFDIVIGNPPYQKTTGQSNEGTVPSGSSIYQDFVIKSITLCTRCVCMITPNKWFSGNKKLDTLREYLLKSNHVSCLHNFECANDVFPNIIMDQICYYVYDKNYTGMCTFISHEKGLKSCSTVTRYLSTEGSDCFIRNPVEAQIVGKVLAKNEQSIETVTSGKGLFGLGSFTRGNSEKQSESDLILHYTGYDCQGDNTAFISRDLVTKGKDWIGCHKVIYPAGGSTNDRIFTRVLYAGPDEVCTESYIAIGAFKNKECSLNAVSYLKTKFVRTLIKVRKIDQNMIRDRLRFVPVQDFSKPWTDQMLYDKYGLSPDEIAYIENTIKPME